MVLASEQYHKYLMLCSLTETVLFFFWSEKVLFLQYTFLQYTMGNYTCTKFHCLSGSTSRSSFQPCILVLNHRYPLDCIAPSRMITTNCQVHHTLLAYSKSVITQIHELSFDYHVWLLGFSCPTDAEKMSYF